MKKDSLSLVKLLLFVAIFLVVLTLFLILFIIPSMKQYKTNEAVLKRYESMLDKKESEIELLKSKKVSLGKKYKEYIDKYRKNFDEKEFENFLKDYAKDISIVKKSESDEKTIYQVELTVDNMKEYYKIINEIKNINHIVSISFPITINREDKSYKIVQDVTILHAKLKKRL